jgi:hypothetical protein
MTQRERYLSILVGGLLVGVVIWWGFGKYRTALRLRNNQITMLQNDQQRLVEQQLQGEYANRQMGEYMVRSLPGNPERAQSRYQQWLLGMVQANKLSKALVDPNSSRSISGLYQLIDFRVRGNTDLPNLINLLHAFYAKDYLHRIRDLSIRESKEGDYSIEMSIDVIAFLSAPNDLPVRDETSWRVDADVAAYLDPIMNRNLYEPPNGAPDYTGREEVEAYVGRDTPVPLTFKDPEGHPMRYEFAEPPPDYVRLDSNSGTLRIESKEKHEFEVFVRAIDSGYPRRTTEKKLLVKVVDPPPPPVKQEFDDSTQTVLTALVQGRDEWTAWMHVRTRDKTLRLKVGDGFEIGSLKGQVVGVTARYVTLEIDGRRFELKPAGNLSEAARRAEQD